MKGKEMTSLKVFSMPKWKLFFMWACLVPVGIGSVIYFYPPISMDVSLLLLFCFFAFLTAYFPIMKDGKALFLPMWITIPVFLKYGIVAEILVMQFAIIGTTLRQGINTTMTHHFLFNSMLSFFLSLIAASAFYIAGGQIGTVYFWPLFSAVLCYQIVYATVDNLIARTTSIQENQQEMDYYKDFRLNYISNIIVTPLVLAVYFLWQFVGYGPVILIGCLFFFITYIMRTNTNLSKINLDLKLIEELRHKISAETTEEKLIEKFVLEVSQLFEADYAYFLRSTTSELQLERRWVADEILPPRQQKIYKKGEGIFGYIALHEIPVLYTKREEWQSFIAEELGNDSESILGIPIIRNKELVAVFLLSSKKKKHFTQHHMQLADLLCSYFAIAKERVHYLESLEDEINYCELTKLYNYRFLEQYLQKEIEGTMYGELSLVLLDIDHFKTINDIYGHQSGNDILRSFAEVIKQLTPAGSIPTRYGGEEFICLLPNTSKEEAMQFSEALRLEIEKTVFKITPDIGHKREETDVSLTVSIGISSTPSDTIDPLQLIRNADHALYIGAKRQGRNRVAAFTK